MQSTLNIPVPKLRQFQEIVKQHNLRFIGNPRITGDVAWVSVDGDHLPPGGCNDFWADWARVTTPIRETITPVWKRMLRHCGVKVG
jgi:hypothetical protein